MKRCDVCGANTETFVCCSACGGMSFAYCEECLKAGAEPWGVLIDYISIAGHYPEDINEDFREIVRNTCKRCGKTESEFAKLANELYNNF